MKRTVSILLCISLMLSLFTVMAMAGTTVGEEASTLPNGYTQMYYKAGEEYLSSVEISIDSMLSLSDALYADSQGTVSISQGDGGYVLSLSRGEGLGALVPPPEDVKIAIDTYSNASVGTSGYLYATKGDQKYALPISIVADNKPNQLYRMYFGNLISDKIVAYANGELPLTLSTQSSMLNPLTRDYRIYCTEGMGSLEWETVTETYIDDNGNEVTETYDELVWHVADVSNYMSGYIYAEYDGVTYSIAIEIAVALPYVVVQGKNEILPEFDGENLVFTVPCTMEGTTIEICTTENGVFFGTGSNVTVTVGPEGNRITLTTNKLEYESTALIVDYAGGSEWEATAAQLFIWDGENFVEHNPVFVFECQTESDTDDPPSSGDGDDTDNPPPGGGEDEIVYPFEVYDSLNGENKVPLAGNSYVVICDEVDGVLQSKTVYFILHDTNLKFNENCQVSLEGAGGTESLISGVQMENNTVFAVTFAGGTESNVSVAVSLYTDDDWEGNFTIIFTSRTLEHPLLDSEKYMGDLGNVDPGGPAAVYAGTVNGTRYYIAPVMYTNEEHAYPSFSHSMDPILEWGPYEQHTFGIGVFTSSGNNYYWVTNGSEGDESDDLLTYVSKALFENVELQVKAFGTRSENSNSLVYPQKYPTLTPDTGKNDYLLDPISMQMGLPQEGTWILTAVATPKGGGNSIVSNVRYTWNPQDAIIWEPSGEGDVIEELNDFLAVPNPNEDAWLVINLPGGHHNGYIEVPKEWGFMYIKIKGERQQGNGGEKIYTTYLHGGIIAENFLCAVEEINFVGVGADKEFYDHTAETPQIPNYAISGYAGGTFRRSTFTGYRCAVYVSGRLKTGTNNLFEKNYTAVCFNTNVDDGGNEEMNHNNYTENTIGLHFKHLHEETPMTWFDFSKCWFYGNKTDVQNDMENRIVYMPRCYFEHGYTSQSAWTSDVWDGFGSGRLGGKGTVYVYPASKNEGFTDFFYRKKDGTAGDAHMYMGHIKTGENAKYHEFLGTMTIHDDKGIHHIWKKVEERGDT